MGRASCIWNALTNAVISLQFDGEKIVYENEVRALWADLPLRRISRDSELRCVWKPFWVILSPGYPIYEHRTYLLLPCYRLTVLCSFSNGDASLTIRVDNLPPLASSMNQGPLSLVLLSYPGKADSGLRWLESNWILWGGGCMSELFSGAWAPNDLMCFLASHPCYLRQMP